MGGAPHPVCLTWMEAVPKCVCWSVCLAVMVKVPATGDARVHWGSENIGVPAWLGLWYVRWTHSAQPQYTGRMFMSQSVQMLALWQNTVRNCCDHPGVCHAPRLKIN